MWLTARPVTTETLRSMDAEYLGGLKMQRHQQKQKAQKLEIIVTNVEAKLVARAASLNLSVEQYVTKKRKAEGISSPKKGPNKAKGNDVDDPTPSPSPSRSHSARTAIMGGHPQSVGPAAAPGPKNWCPLAREKRPR